MHFKDNKVILPETLQLLEQLQANPAFDSFILVGGTALALQFGHRLSIDLDLFSEYPFDTQVLETYLQDNFLFSADYVASNTLKGFVENIKVDFITHPYPMVYPLITEGDLRIASPEDIGAMKLNAIAHSGTRQKDFYDIFVLLEHLTLDTLIQAYKTKYPKSNPIAAMKGLTYFDDINFDVEKPMLNRKITFATVKKRLIQAVRAPHALFK